MQNSIDDVKSIHFMAVCGTGMGALAVLLKTLGYRVTGSDDNVYPPMSTYLLENGIEIQKPFQASNLSYGPDLVVVGNAVSRPNPEVQGMLKSKLAYCSMPEAINRFIVKDKVPVVVTGTHGKTTTASLVAWILHVAGLAPSYLIGGILKNFNRNADLGHGSHVVLEGDEYDTAFFDKEPKFLHYTPGVAVLTSVEFDHADVFRDLDHVKEKFSRFVGQMSSSQTLVACMDDPNVVQIIRNAACTTQGYSSQAHCDWSVTDLKIRPPQTDYTVLHQGQPFLKVHSPLMGRHNLANTLAAVAVAHELKIAPDFIGQGVATFEGIRRRQEIRGVRNRITVIDDFAHHPTAVRETIRALRPFFPDGRLWAVFEPRTNTSMRKVFQTAYSEVFDEADRICIQEPSALHKVPEDERFSARQLVLALVDRGLSAHYFQETSRIIRHLTARARPGDAILVMSNGGFSNIHNRLLKALS